MSAKRIKESIEISRKNNYPEYICLQPEYNLYDRKEYETNYELLVKEFGLGVVSYYSLASGFLTGKYKTIGDITNSQRKTQLQNYINDRGQRILSALSEVAEEYHATAGQIALAWLLSRSTITAPIASVSNAGQLDILKCVDIHLSKDAVDKLNVASKY